MATRFAWFTHRPLLGMLIASLGFLTTVESQANAGDQRRPVIISALHGEVQVSSSGAPVRAAVGMILKLPAAVRTGASGSIELRQGETIVSAAPNAALEIPLSADPTETLDRIIQSRGNVYYSVAKRTSSKLNVETRYLVAVIKGTRFNVSVTDTASTLSLLEGLIELRSPDGSDVTEISAGQVGTLSVDQPRIRVLNLTSGEVIRAGLPAMNRQGATSAEAPVASNSVFGTASDGSASVPGMAVASGASTGSASSVGLIASNRGSANVSGGVGSAANDTVGALKSLTARTNANAANATAGGGNANAGGGNANAGGGNANAGGGNANAGGGNANAGNGNNGNNGNNSSVTDLVQNLQNLANNGKSNGKGKP